MLPLRLVIDTNVLVSAAIKPAGLQRTVFLIAISKPARLYVSHPILEEYGEVLARPELRIRKGLRLRLPSKTFSEILEENKGCNPRGVCQSCGTAFGKVADCSTACINAGLTRRSWPVAFTTAADLLRNSTSFPKQ